MLDTLFGSQGFGGFQQQHEAALPQVSGDAEVLLGSRGSQSCARGPWGLGRVLAPLPSSPIPHWGSVFPSLSLTGCVRGATTRWAKSTEHAGCSETTPATPGTTCPLFFLHMRPLEMRDQGAVRLAEACDASTAPSACRERRNLRPTLEASTRAGAATRCEGLFPSAFIAPDPALCPGSWGEECSQSRASPPRTTLVKVRKAEGRGVAVPGPLLAEVGGRQPGDRQRVLLLPGE